MYQQDTTQTQPTQPAPQMQPMPQQAPVQQHPHHKAPSLDKGALSSKVQQLFILFYTALSIGLTARFVFSLLGTNLSSPFVLFVYQITQPFIVPFANMFGVALQAGRSRVEFEDLVALLVYALLFFGLAKLINIIFD